MEVDEIVNSEGLEQRCARLKLMLAERGAGAALITDPANIYYLTGWRTNPHERFTGLFVPRDAEPALVVPSLDVESARSSWITDVRGWRDGESPYGLLADVARGRWTDGGTLAVEKAAISLDTFEGVAAALKPSATVDARPLLGRLRVVKDEEELRLLRRAAEIACEALGSVCRLVREGMTEKEVAGLLDQAVRSFGGDGPAFDTTVLSGPRSALPHGQSGERRISDGDALVVDFGASYRGYVSDITRTFFVGHRPQGAAAALLDAYEAVLAGHDAAIASVKPGTAMEEVDRAARDAIERRGFGRYFVHRTGHGLGLAVHEEPYFVEGNRERLVPGMVATVEPGVYLPGIGGVRIEDDVVVTPDGSLALTVFPVRSEPLG